MVLGGIVLKCRAIADKVVSTEPSISSIVLQHHVLDLQDFS
jgi:hypothetical protein